MRYTQHVWTSLYSTITEQWPTPLSTKYAMHSLFFKDVGTEEKHPKVKNNRGQWLWFSGRASLLTPEVHGSNPIIGKKLTAFFCRLYLKDENKKKRPGMAYLKKIVFQPRHKNSFFGNFSADAWDNFPNSDVVLSKFFNNFYKRIFLSLSKNQQNLATSVIIIFALPAMPPVWPEKNRQMSIKVTQKWFH